MKTIKINNPQYLHILNKSNFCLKKNININGKLIIMLCLATTAKLKNIIDLKLRLYFKQRNDNNNKKTGTISNCPCQYIIKKTIGDVQ